MSPLGMEEWNQVDSKAEKPRSEKLDWAFKFNEVQQTSHLKYMFVPLGFGGLDRVGKWDTETAGEKLFP